VRVAHLAYTIGTNELRPTDARWSVNLIDAGAILADARWARENGAEFTIVSLHWGTQYQVSPDWEQTRLAETLTASPDVDLILGHHVHAVQPIARVNGTVVVYGMGDHLSNIQTAADGAKHGAEDGTIVHLTVEEQDGGRFEVTTVAVTPTWVNPSTKQVLPVAHTLAYGEGAPAWALEASLARTTERVGRDDAALAALSPQPWPSLVCDGRVATIVGTAGPDFLVGTADDDVIVGREGRDTILGGGGHDLICSGEGDDVVWGGPGADTVHGGDGADLLSGGDGDDRLWGEAGDDRLGGGAGGDLLDGAEGGDVLSGHVDDDQLTGGPGADWLWGGTGADTLEGSSAADRLCGDPDDSCHVQGVVGPCR
jgi:Ca2+-binding RTX toxin-like protein